MTTLRLLGLACWLVLLAACAPAVVPPAPTASPAPTNTALPSATPLPSPTAPAVQQCQRPSDMHLGFGFPRSEHRLPSLGTVRAIVLFADFADAPATRSPQDVFAMLSPQAEEFFTVQSYGRLELQLQPYFVWLRLSQPSAQYGASLTSYYEHLNFLQEAVNLADPVLDFSQADAVVLINNPDAYEIQFGPTYTGFLDSGLTADGVIIPNGMTSGTDLMYWGYLWLNHEFGHSLGLPDLYAYGEYNEMFPYTGGFSVMGDIFGHAPELTAFERWMLGWLDDEQVYCLSPGQTVELTLMAIEQPGGLKALVMPLDESRLLVVESRRQLGFDAAMEEPGALVYIVDASVASGYGPMLVLPQTPQDMRLGQATLQLGDVLDVEQLTVRVLEHGELYDRVQVSWQP